jgi:uncharacterized protein
MKTLRIAIALAAVAVSLSAQAQTAAAPATTTHEKVRHLLQLTGAGELGTQMIDQMIVSFKQTMPDVPDEFWTGFRAKVKPSDMVDMLVPVYEKHLTEADLDALIAFYSSPVGRRFVEKQPLILADSMKIGQAWGERLAGEVVDELQKKGYGKKE